MDASDRRKRVVAEAAEWWIVLQGDVTRAQREQYIDWLRESALHVAEMLRMTQVHGALEQFERWTRIPTDSSAGERDTVITLPSAERRESLRPNTESHRSSRRVFVWSLAATLALVAFVGILLVTNLRGQVIQTDRGERRDVSLADGSDVQIDPETRLRVEYEQHTRRVVLERGRALFHVAKNADRPFLVQARETTIRAVGTAFAVERQSTAVVVTVAEGTVAVGKKADSGGSSGSSIEPAGHAETAAGELAPVLLTANEQVTVEASGQRPRVKRVDSARALAWAEGKLIFQHQSLEQAIGQFNRYNRIQLYINNQDLGRRPVSGVFNAADPESFVAFIQSVLPVKVSRNDASEITIDVAD